MDKWNFMYFKLSIIISIFLSVSIPSNPIIDGDIIRYNYGFPFYNITIYQKETTSAWFFENFFNGNLGLLINPLTLVVNIIALYCVIWCLVWVFNKIPKKN